MSIIYEDTEYLWNGDGRSPVLFPMIGSIEGEKTKIGNNDYEIESHIIYYLAKTFIVSQL